VGVKSDRGGSAPAPRPPPGARLPAPVPDTGREPAPVPLPPGPRSGGFGARSARGSGPPLGPHRWTPPAPARAWSRWLTGLAAAALHGPAGPPGPPAPRRRPHRQRPGDKDRNL